MPGQIGIDSEVMLRVLTMNENTIPETVLLCEKQIERRVELSSNSPVLPTNTIERQLIWSSRKPDDWEVLVYKHTEGWEACFFRWPIHHEHATGSSFNSVRQRAEQRIRILEAGRLKRAEWRQTICWCWHFRLWRTKNLAAPTAGA